MSNPTPEELAAAAKGMTAPNPELMEMAEARRLARQGAQNNGFSFDQISQIMNVMGMFGVNEDGQAQSTGGLDFQTFFADYHAKGEGVKFELSTEPLGLNTFMSFAKSDGPVIIPQEAYNAAVDALANMIVEDPAILDKFGLSGLSVMENITGQIARAETPQQKAAIKDQISGMLLSNINTIEDPAIKGEVQAIRVLVEKNLGQALAGGLNDVRSQLQESGILSWIEEGLSTLSSAMEGLGQQFGFNLNLGALGFGNLSA